MKHSSETRIKISKALKGRVPTRGMLGHRHSKETKNKMGVAQTGALNHMFGKKHSIEARTKMSASLKGKTPWNKGKEATPEAKEKMSKARCRAIQEGRVNPEQNRLGMGGDFYSKKNDAVLHYRSKLELHWYQLLEELSTVESYQVEPVVIKYEFEGSVHHYIPDLRIRYKDGTVDLVEIKPENQRDELKNLAKWKAAREWCATRHAPRTFRVVGYEELKK